MTTEKPRTNECTDQFIDFFSRYYAEEISELAMQYPSEQRSLYIEYDDIAQYDLDIAQDWIEHPRRIRECAEEALRLYDLPIDVTFTDVHVRLTGLPKYLTAIVGKINPERYHGKLVALTGQVIEETTVQPDIKEAKFECQRCGTVTYIPQTTGELQQPHECQGCERQGPFSLDEAGSTTVNYQRLRVQTPPEKSSDGRGTIDVNLYDDLAGEAQSGDRVTITAVLEGSQKQVHGTPQTTVELYADAVAITHDETDWQDTDVDAHRDRIEDLAASDDPYEKIVQSIKRSHMGHDPIKLALALQLFGGVEKESPDGSHTRGTIHVLLIGDPGVDKSGLLSYATELTPGGIYTDGSGSTKAGLTASAVQSDFDGGGWVIRGGTLVQAHRSIAAIDELGDMDESDRAGLKETMADGRISVSKADNVLTLPATTSVLAAMNPKFGRFDPYTAIGEQIDLHPAVLSRFDLIFPMTDDIDPERDASLAEHLNEMARVGQKIANDQPLSETEREEAEPIIDPETLRGYVAYAREHVHPVLSEEAEAYIAEHYVQMRQAGADDDIDRVPVTARSIEALHRLAEASARIRLSDTVEREDAERVIELWRDSMRRVGVDPETGEFDADVVETGQSSSQRERRQTLLTIIEEYETDPAYDYGAPRDELLDDAIEAGLTGNEAADALTHLRDTGKLYTPKQNVFATP